MFNIPETGYLLNVDRYEINGRLVAVFAQSIDQTETFCASLPDYKFTGNRLRRFYKYAYTRYGLSKSDFYGRYSEHNGCYERTVEEMFLIRRLYLIGSEAYLKAIAEEWEKRL